MGEVLKKAVVSLVVVAAVVWAVHWAMMSRAVENRDYGDMDESAPPQAFAGAWYDYGLRAWYEHRLDDAKDHFEQAAALNPFHVDAWLKLAEVHQAAGEKQEAREVLLFTDRLAGNVVKWKWKQLLMARQLGMKEMFLEIVNFVIPYPQLRGQALELVDAYYSRRTTEVLAVLAPGNLADYLQWLMRRERTAGSLETWRVLTDQSSVDPELYERYIHFLFRQKEIAAAVRIREQYKGLADEMANPGFESQVSGHVFGWQAWSRESWNVRRDRYQARQGNYALRVDFSGKQNINFYHVRQCVPVVPGRTYTLSFCWRSENLTTDELPYMEVRGMSCKNSRWKTAMVPRDTDWTRVGLAFTAGPDCHAVMIRLRRNKSHRFDNKIDGTIWLDDFVLKKQKVGINNGERKEQ